MLVELFLVNLVVIRQKSRVKMDLAELEARDICLPHTKLFAGTTVRVGCSTSAKSAPCGYSYLEKQKQAYSIRH